MSSAKANKENVVPNIPSDYTAKLNELQAEIEQLKKDKKQKLFQFESMDTLLKKTKAEASEYKKKYEEAIQEVKKKKKESTT
jgi:chromosome segregation ATPase